MRLREVEDLAEANKTLFSHLGNETTGSQSLYVCVNIFFSPLIPLALRNDEPHDTNVCFSAARCARMHAC